MKTFVLRAIFDDKTLHSIKREGSDSLFVLSPFNRGVREPWIVVHSIKSDGSPQERRVIWLELVPDSGGWYAAQRLDETGRVYDVVPISAAKPSPRRYPQLDAVTKDDIAIDLKLQKELNVGGQRYCPKCKQPVQKREEHVCSLGILLGLGLDKHAREMKRAMYEWHKNANAQKQSTKH